MDVVDPQLRVDRPAIGHKHKPVVAGVLFGVVNDKRLVDRRAFPHDFYRAARIGRDVADCEQTVRQVRAAGTGWYPWRRLGS